MAGDTENDSRITRSNRAALKTSHLHGVVRKNVCVGLIDVGAQEIFFYMPVEA